MRGDRRGEVRSNNAGIDAGDSELERGAWAMSWTCALVEGFRRMASGNFFWVLTDGVETTIEIMNASLTLFGSSSGLRTSLDYTKGNFLWAQKIKLRVYARLCRAFSNSVFNALR
jgi:hypothetical protein